MMSGGAATRRLKPMSWPGLASLLLAEVRLGRTLLLLSDYDGTLTPIVRDPRDARLTDDVRGDLHSLASSSYTRLGIISGRALDDVRDRVGARDAVCAGCHGLEIQGPGITFRHPATTAAHGRLASLATLLEQRTAELSGIAVEFKGSALAVHYRNSSQVDRARLQRVLTQSLRNRRRGLRVLYGRKVVEIIPTRDWDKGQAALRIRNHVRRASTREVTTVYLGDDNTDELAFWALGASALTVKVGCSMATLAACALADVEDVRRLLSALAANVAPQSPPGPCHSHGERERRRIHGGPPRSDQLHPSAESLTLTHSAMAIQRR